MTDSDFSNDLIIEEYKACRETIIKNIEIMESKEVYALGSAAALFVFSISAEDRMVALASAWKPLVIAVVGSVRFLGLDRTIDIANAY